MFSKIFSRFKKKPVVQTGTEIINEVIGGFESQVKKLEEGIAKVNSSIEFNEQLIAGLQNDNARHKETNTRASKVLGKINEIIAG